MNKKENIVILNGKIKQYIVQKLNGKNDYLLELYDPKKDNYSLNNMFCTANDLILLEKVIKKAIKYYNIDKKKKK
jgi:hypothetical protein